LKQKLAEKKAELAKKRAEKAKADKEAADKAKKAAELTDKQKARAERKLAEKKAAEKKAAEAKKTETAKTNKPTPEQILNSGSIEKARQEANKGALKEAKKAEADKSSAKADNAKAEAKTAEGGKKVILQMGSYADRNSADAQRAKLAMLGISSKVVERTNGDKTVYRVQSNSMSSEAAKNIQKDLQKHNINSLMRSAQ